MIISLFSCVVSIVTAIFIYLVVKKHFLYKGKLPPGPKGQWIINNLFLLSEPLLHIKINKELRKKFVKYMTLWIFHKPYVIINDYRKAVDLYVNDYPVATAGRPQFNIFLELTEGGKSIFASQIGSQWSYQRKLFHSALRKMAQNVKLDDHTKSAFRYFKEVLIENSNKSNGKGIFPYDETYLLAYNINFAITFGKTFKPDNPEFITLRNNAEFVNKCFLENGAYFDIPFYHKLPIPSVINMKKSFKELADYTTKMIDEHEKRNTYKTDPQDTVDYILNEKEQLKVNDNSNLNFMDISYMRQSLLDIIFAGTDTTALSVNWMLGILATRQHIVLKIRQEIKILEEEEGREISVIDKQKMDYTCAVLTEIFRYSSLVTYGIFHEILTDNVKIDEYDIPKGAVVTLNQYEFHNDPDYWESPEQFNPDRFLLNGKLVPKKDGLMPFSCGRRVCLGESVAKSDLFLILCLICKELDITWTETNSDTEVKERSTNTLFRYIDDYKILIKAKDNKN